MLVSSKSKKCGSTCHCNMCRKWGGGAFLAVECGSDVSFEGEENIGVYESDEWAERGFCQRCGSHLFYKLKQNNQYFMPAGLFDGSDGLVFDQLNIPKRASSLKIKN